MNESVEVKSEIAFPPGIYDRLIEQAYIDPIRTVIVVDDEFPSLDSLIEKELNGTRPWNGNEGDARKVSEILKYCRNRDRPWLVDVHDGREVSIRGEERIAPYLHHSDLMILDYHLNGDAGTGDHAIGILRDLAKNDHFNMVIVYTKGESDAIGNVFREIAISLMDNNPEWSFIPDRPKETLKEAITDWEDIDPDIESKLMEFIDDQTYLDVRKTNSCRQLLDMPTWDLIADLLTSAPKKLPAQLWAKWLIAKKHESLSQRLSSTDLGDVSWVRSSDLNWLRTDRLFVTVISKNNAADILPGMLKTAIINWCPSPHQLLMARMRAQMNEHGVLAESGVLRDRFLQAGWMQQLFGESCIDRKQNLKNTVDRHWEALGDHLRSNIDEYAGELSSHLDELGEKEVFKRFFSHINLSKENEKILKRLNTYACLKARFEQSHLMTGHILKIGDDLWACLTPACDLVPGQKKTGWYGRLGDYLPFKAVLLHKVSDELALSQANQNIFVFIPTENNTDCYSFCPSGETHSNPHWEQFFAKNGGRFNDTEGNFSVGRLIESNNTLSFSDSPAKVRCQLRYEYALNLLQRLGHNLSRVGLDYHGSEPSPL